MKKQKVSKEDVINEIGRTRELLDNIEKKIDLYLDSSLKSTFKAVSKFRRKFHMVYPYTERFEREILK